MTDEVTTSERIEECFGYALLPDEYWGIIHGHLLVCHSYRPPKLIHRDRTIEELTLHVEKS